MAATVGAAPTAGPAGRLLTLRSRKVERNVIGMTGPAKVSIGGLLRQRPQDQALRIHIIS